MGGWSVTDWTDLFGASVSEAAIVAPAAGVHVALVVDEGTVETAGCDGHKRRQGRRRHTRR